MRYMHSHLARKLYREGDVPPDIVVHDACPVRDQSFDVMPLDVFLYLMEDSGRCKSKDGNFLLEHLKNRNPDVYRLYEQEAARRRQMDAYRVGASAAHHATKGARPALPDTDPLRKDVKALGRLLGDPVAAALIDDLIKARIAGYKG